MMTSAMLRTLGIFALAVNVKATTQVVANSKNKIRIGQTPPYGGPL